MNKAKKIYSSEDLAWAGLNFLISSGAVFYRVFLLFMVWQWFIADKLFDVSYWGMFLVTIIFSLFTGGFSYRLSTSKRISKGSNNPVALSDKEEVKVTIKAMAMSTFIFGVIAVVYILVK